MFGTHRQMRKKQENAGKSMSQREVLDRCVCVGCDISGTHTHKRE